MNTAFPLLASNDHRSNLFPNGMLNDDPPVVRSYAQDQLIQQQQTQRTQMQNESDKVQTMMWVGGLVVAALIIGLLVRGKK